MSYFIAHEILFTLLFLKCLNYLYSYGWRSVSSRICALLSLKTKKIRFSLTYDFHTTVELLEKLIRYLSRVTKITNRSKAVFLQFYDAFGIFMKTP